MLGVRCNGWSRQPLAPEGSCNRSTLELLAIFQGDLLPRDLDYAQDAACDVALSRLPRAHRGLAAGAVVVSFSALGFSLSVRSQKQAQGKVSSRNSPATNPTWILKSE